MNWPVAGAIAWAMTAGLFGGLMTEIGPWYRELRKPSWQPPQWLFGPAWAVILGSAAWAGALAWNHAADHATQERVSILFAVNLAFHLLWTPLFFRLKRPDWSLIEVIFMWLSVASLVIGLTPISGVAGLLLAPYLAWVSFATALNLAIVRLNPPFGRR
jgi:tryptophan-rich sensory protein